MEPIHLFEIPNGSKLRLPVGKEGSEEFEVKDVIFNHIDGMYSHCTVVDSGATVHLAAVAPMKKVDDHYELADASDEETE